MEKFEVGKIYYTRSIGDHNCIFTVEVLKRTAKTMLARVDGREIKTLRISASYRGHEMVKPHGSYSMAAMIDATDSEKLVPDWQKVGAL